MIAFYRRIACFVPKNLCRQFCAESEHIRVKDDKGIIYHLYSSPNVQVQAMFISKPERLDPAVVTCAIQVKAGFFDDPMNHPGLAHLTEHVVAHCTSREHISHFDCTTKVFDTVFSFSTRFNNINNEFATWTKYMLSSTPLREQKQDITAILQRELDALDNEFYERSTSTARTIRILDLEGMVPHKFGGGNKKSVVGGLENTRLMFDEIDNHRVLYRKRPLTVCFISKNEIDKELREHMFNLLQHYRDKNQDVESINWKCECSQDNSKRLLVVESDEYLQELRIFFPFTKPLNEKERNSLESYGNMIRSKIANYLVHYLRDQEMGTECECQLSHDLFIIVINLTSKGMEHIHLVSGALFKYLQFLHDNWEKLDEFMYRQDEHMLKDDSSLKYIQKISSNIFVDKLDVAFDGDRLKKALVDSRDEERQLISQQILTNKNVVHTISARDTEHVNHVLLERFHLTKPLKKHESTYKVNYYVHETNMFEDAVKNVEKKFELIDLRPYKSEIDGKGTPEQKISGTILYEYAFVAKSEDVIFQTYFMQYLAWKTVHTQAIYNRFTKPCRFFVSKGSLLASWFGVENRTILKQIDLSALPIKDFDHCKEHLMRQLSIEVVDSSMLARSLMDTAVANHHLLEIKRDPLPMQYHKYMAMNNSTFTTHFKKQETLSRSSNITFKVDPSINNICKEKLIIESINKNELKTVTLIFCKMHQSEQRVNNNNLCNIVISLSKMKTELHLYTLEEVKDTVQGVKGYLVKIISVEKKKQQRSDQILNRIDEIFEDVIVTPAEDELPSSLLDYRMLVQIKGYKKKGGNTGTFDEDFNHWFHKYKNEFERFTSTGDGT